MFLYTQIIICCGIISGDSPSKSLKLDFYEGCINEDPKVCTTKKKSTSDSYLRYFSGSERQECFNFEQVAESMNDFLTFCVDMENSLWYGGAETTFQKWPLNKLDWTNKSFVTRELDSQAVSTKYIFSHTFPVDKSLSNLY